MKICNIQDEALLIMGITHKVIRLKICNFWRFHYKKDLKRLDFLEEKSLINKVLCHRYHIIVAKDILSYLERDQNQCEKV